MSCTLMVRKKPKTKWPWSFKGNIRDRLRKKFNDSIPASREAISYLEGLRDSLTFPGIDNDQAEMLQGMIEALHDGNDLELDYQC